MNDSSHGPVEGTFTIEGLIEGRVSSLPDLLPTLEEWVQFARQTGLRFHLQTTATGLSILPETEPAPVERLGDEAHEAIGQVVRQLIEQLPEQDRPNLFSTLRSEEFRKGEAVQAVYLVQPDGSLKVETRTVEADTVEPPQPLSRADRLRAVGVGLLVAAAIVGVLSLFVDIRGTAQQFIDTVRPVNAEEIAVEAGPLAPYLAIGEREVKRGGVLAIELRRGADYPVTLEQLNAIAQSQTLAAELAAHAIARGYIHAELFNRDGEYLGTVSVRIRPLQQAEAMELELALPRRARVGRVAFTY